MDEEYKKIIFIVITFIIAMFFSTLAMSLGIGIGIKLIN